MEKYFGKIIFGLITIISIIFWLAMSFKAMVFFIGTFSLFMFVNVSVVTLCNALVGRETPPKGDVIWKMFFILLTCICFVVWFNV